MGLTVPLLTVAIRQENDILLARQRARQISQFLCFSSGDIARITTALSEVARNAFDSSTSGRTSRGVTCSGPGMSSG